MGGASGYRAVFVLSKKENLTQRAQSSEERARVAATDCDEVYGLPRSLHCAATKGVAATVGMKVNSDREVVEAATPEG